MSHTTTNSGLLKVLLWLSCLVAVSLACLTFSGGGTSAPDFSNASDQVTIQSDVTWGSGTFVLQDPRIGLSDLASYTATLELAFDGTRDGKAQRWTKTYVMLSSLKPNERELSLAKSGDLTDLDTSYAAERDGTSYDWKDKAPCTARQIEQGNSLSDHLEPASFLHLVVGADDAGTDTTNGVQSKHYTFDQQALGQEGQTQSKGEAWVATAGGYVVKYLLSTTAKSDYFGEGIEGTLTQDYELTDVGKPVQIALPDNCPGGVIDAPTLTDAANVFNQGGALSYDTSSSIKDVVKFYQEQLPPLGWKAGKSPDIGKDSALFTFVKGDQTMTIAVYPSTGKTHVLIGVGKTSPASAAIPNLPNLPNVPNIPGMPTLTP